MKAFVYPTTESRSYSSPYPIHALRKPFVPEMTTCVPGNVIANRKIQSLQRSSDYLQLVQQAEHYMVEHLDHALSIDTLCAILFVSRRTLHNAFQEIVEVGPMNYLKIQRMKQVHHQLERAYPLTTTVFDIAYQCGFWHMGHFSRDYKQMFSEFPSDTLKREPLLQ